MKKDIIKYKIYIIISEILMIMGGIMIGIGLVGVIMFWMIK